MLYIISRNTPCDSPRDDEPHGVLVHLADVDGVFCNSTLSTNPRGLDVSRFYE